MKLYTLKRSQRLPITIEEAWEFFSDPGNLSEITPPKLQLRVTSDLPDRTHQGMVISYRLQPFRAIRVGWMTEITHVDAPRSFVDEQRFGPYRFWHHLHQFETVDGGVEVRDIVNYGLPFGWIGRLARGLLVRRSLEQIFDFRAAVLRARFGSITNALKVNE